MPQFIDRSWRWIVIQIECGLLIQRSFQNRFEALVGVDPQPQRRVCHAASNRVPLYVFANPRIPRQPR